MSPEVLDTISVGGLPRQTDTAHPWEGLPVAPTKQFAQNILTTILPDRLDALRTLLRQIDDETAAAMSGRPLPGAVMSFGQVTSLHYARWVILDTGGQLRLALTLHFDGPVGRETSQNEALKKHIQELVATNRSGLDAVYACCQDYPSAAADNAAVESYLLRPNPAVAPPTFYCGSVGRSRDQIRQEADLRSLVARWLDKAIADGTLPATPAAIREAMLKSMGPIPAFPAQTDRRGLIKVVLGLAVLVFILLFIFVRPLAWALLILLAVLFAILRYKECTDPEFNPIFSAEERERVRRMAANENRYFQNALSNVVEVKPGLFRLWLMRAVLWAIGFLARNVFVHGRLGDLETIHFAHWYPLDGGKRLAFVSNFDGSWESYLGDFIDQASNGLTAVWSNTVGYPQTVALVFAGSRAGERFKDWARYIQVPTQVWYSAYPDLSVTNIQDNTLIRRGLADESAVPPEVWLAKVS